MARRPDEIEVPDPADSPLLRYFIDKAISPVPVPHFFTQIPAFQPRRTAPYCCDTDLVDLGIVAEDDEHDAGHGYICPKCHALYIVPTEE